MKRDTPGPGQESVWDYPRPPELRRVERPVKIVFAGKVLAETTRAYSVHETSHPPVYYIPLEDVDASLIERVGGSSYCEWKGSASYVDVVAPGRRAERAGWYYADPVPDFAPIKDHVAFYAGPMDACFVGDDEVTPQPGGFYGGWITPDVVGPFKGAPGSWGW